MTQKSSELLKKYSDAVDARLSGRRLQHVHSVSEYAAEVARIYGVDEYDATVAGLLHDWDKLLLDEDFPARLEELGIEPPEHVELMLPVLHSFTGAKAVEREFPELEPQIITAIWRHTLGAPCQEMSDLDIIIFCADQIEPTRSAAKRPHLNDLRAMVGQASLQELYFACYCETMTSLITRKRFIHPQAFEIWNGLILQHNPHPGAKGQGNPDVLL